MNNLLLDYVVSEVKHLRSGEEFIVQNLFKGDEWDRLSLAERRTLGNSFYKLVVKNLSIDVIPLEKTSLNQMVYIKK